MIQRVAMTSELTYTRALVSLSFAPFNRVYCYGDIDHEPFFDWVESLDGRRRDDDHYVFATDKNIALITKYLQENASLFIASAMKDHGLPFDSAQDCTAYINNIEVNSGCLSKLIFEVHPSQCDENKLMDRAIKESHADVLNKLRSALEQANNLDPSCVSKLSHHPRSPDVKNIYRNEEKDRANTEAYFVIETSSPMFLLSQLQKLFPRRNLRKVKVSNDELRMTIHQNVTSEI
jgi:hypothetical protein